MKNIRTRISNIFGIDYPIIQGGMIWVSGWRLASAVSNAGGLGLIGAGSMSPALLIEHIKKCRANCKKPFGVNIPVSNRHADDFVDICIQHSVPAVFTSAGSPQKYTGRLKSAGIKVAHVSPNAKLARKVEDAQCDAVIAEGTEAGGHNGRDEITSVNLWPSVADAVSIPMISAGGIVDGRGMTAAFALGAEGVQLGTRFAITKESSANNAYKEAALLAKESDTRLYLRNLMPTRAIANPYLERATELEFSGAQADELMDFRGNGRARKGIFEGDTIRGELEIGQATGRIDQILSAAQVVDKIVEEFHSTAQKLQYRQSQI
jgi:enoyl-[acyl-carrier protein] reductase II